MENTGNNAMTTVKKKRDTNLDLIRCVAIFFLPSLHFMYNSGFYNIPINTPFMYFMVVPRTLFITCIPLFLMLTGYLMCKKELTVKYYWGISRVLIIHFFCTILMFLYMHFFKSHPFNVKEVFFGLFGNLGYSWYVGLYMGLFCLIPFLNLIYRNLDARWKKRTLVITLSALTALPSIGNYFVRLVPDSFLGMYPIAYYFIGAYIREYYNGDKKPVIFVLFLLSLLLSSLGNIAVSYNKNFVWNALNDWGGIENAVVAPLLFMLLRNPDNDQKSCPRALALVITRISEWSFGMYLLSWIFDDFFYPILKSAVSAETERIKCYFIMVPLIFVCSAALSAIVNAAYKLTNKLINIVTKNYFAHNQRNV